MAHHCTIDTFLCLYDVYLSIYSLYGTIKPEEKTRRLREKHLLVALRMAT